MQHIHHLINNWYRHHARDLPWRDPQASGWAVMVSEFMLQQTPVVRVLPVWSEWMRRWPRPQDLAAEPVSEAIRGWGRLGYPRRAVRLHAAAVEITTGHNGVVPSTEAELLALPGVGDYTAAAIACFAFGQPSVVVDTNIRRVHARLFGGMALPEPSPRASEFTRARQVQPTDHETALAWNISVMELGALICTARSPKCEACPVFEHCAWIAAGQPAPHYKPKGQAWQGTDRQVRGAIMAILRSDEGPIEPAAFLTDLASQQDTVFARLQALDAPLEQRRRALAGLLADGLASEEAAGIRLPS
ncbi:A/G-specific adenine glycosylase [Glutamicibacter sp. MNS18]|uniref:A/G-specific adenine glycosylase n=1 Tax=Glutamicibacter sp. MNS18 TaxID=2989817 RepID=UPI002236BE7F|nr:A/G-specific adenine glycosylase [Glutamicibacter sp. MNS18]MCW4467304.1 A/G-specific adenine glycosylase [Glutamicibacter sp. MNS18]